MRDDGGSHWAVPLTTSIKTTSQEKGIGIQIRNEVSPFADGIILYIENPKDSTRELLKTINKYSKVAGYKINVQKIHCISIC